MNSFRKMPSLRPTSTSRARALALGACLALSPMGLTAINPSSALGAESNLPPYEYSLRRLSTVVGALMYLDPLCNGSDPKAWYEQMAAMLDAENADDARRRQLTDRFNKAYRNYARTYPACNAQAAKVTTLYHSEGQAILTQLRLKHAR